MQTSENSLTTQAPLETLASLRIAIGQRDLRTQYSEKPITMHKTFPSKKGMRWPQVIKQAYALLWTGATTRAIIKAPRGGGKSKLLGTLGFDLWYLKKRSVVNMGGSLVQAQVVYGYFEDYCDMDASVATSVAGGIKGVKIGETEANEGHKFNCVTASPKQVRGKHPDVLLSDETCETSDELIDDALPMVNDSENPLVVMASTFHKIFGRFAETWDNAEEMGYTRIQWDIFDVTLPFPADYFENGALKDGTKVCNLNGIERLKKHAKGRTGDPEGWVHIDNIVQAWREKPTENWFEVEYLGTRPSSAGLVLKPEDVDRSVFDSNTETRYNYVTGATAVLGIDWGFSTMTSVVELMRHRDDVAVMLDNVNYHQTSAEEIITETVAKVKAHRIRFIYADSAGKFENVALQNALSKENIGCVVIEVVFSKEKFGSTGTNDQGNGSMLGNLRAHFEQAKFKMPKKFKDAYYQIKNYRYEEGTDKPVKKNDHIPDALMCALQHFKLTTVTRRLPVQGEDNQPDVGSERGITAGDDKKQF